MFTRNRWQAPEVPKLTTSEQIEDYLRKLKTSLSNWLDDLNRPGAVEITPSQIKSTTASPIRLGRDSSGLGDIEEIAGSGGSSITVSDSPLVLGRYSGGSGDVEELSFGTGLQVDSGTGEITVVGAGGSAAALRSSSADTTTDGDDAGGWIVHPSSDDNPRIFTIDSNANVPYALGTAIKFLNRANGLQIKLASDTLIVPWQGSSSGLMLSPNQEANAMKIGTTEWLVTTNPPGPQGTVGLWFNDNAANGTTTFADQSIYARTLTGSGAGASYTNSNPPTGMTTSANFSSADVSMAGWDGTYFAYGDCTLEGYMRPTSVTGSHVIMEFRGIQPNQSLVLFTSGTALVTNYDNATKITGGTIVINTWVHFALSRVNQVMKLFLGGTQIGSTISDNTPYFGVSSKVIVGRDHLAGTAFAGQMASVRFTRGWARYTSNFTPPSLPLSTSA